MNFSEIITNKDHVRFLLQSVLIFLRSILFASEPVSFMASKLKMVERKSICQVSYRFLHHSFGITIISNSFQLMVTIFCLLGGYIT